MTTLRERISDELLPRVRQPAQYIGGEVNQLVEPGDWERADVRVVVAFPDAYTIGMSHLGCQILYWLCNHTPGVCAERTYAPWIDAEQVMRERAIPLFTWDTRQPVVDADILAISLQYELCFTTVLNMLDLAGIPLRHEERMNGELRIANGETHRGPGASASRSVEPVSDRRLRADPPAPRSLDAPSTRPSQFALRNSAEWPLIIVGGPQADNPEPMAEFVDLVVIGDGEHSMAAILDAYKEYKRQGIPRREMVALLARRFPWCYAPNLYDVSYHDDGVIAGMIPKLPGLPTTIERCKTPDFETAPFPTRPLVPWVEVVHDRIAIEIMRGCPQVCRFCHAGYTKRPLHYRTPERILELAEEAYWATGQREIGLLSLSTADYPLLRELADKINARFAPRMVNLSFPSLRVDKMLQHIPWMANSVRKGGITMAVEAARDDMRRAIRKKVTDGNLLDGVREVYKAGWNRVKLYFMAGFPGERDDDITGIWELANAVSNERRSLGLPPAHVTASVGWLVPKPFTPFQWMAQPPIEYFYGVRDRLRELAIGKKGRRDGAKKGRRDGGTKGRRGGATERRSDEATKGSAGVPPGPGSVGVPPARDGTESAIEISGSYGSADEMRSENAFTRAGPRKSATRPITATPPIRATTVSERAGAPAESGRAPAGRRGKVAVKMHDPRRSILEAVFARGDRRLGAVIHEAWRRGARFDGWDETYNHAAWQAAFGATGVDPAWYGRRERAIDEILPWDHIGLRIGRPFLEKGYADVFEQISGRTALPVVGPAVTTSP